MTRATKAARLGRMSGKAMDLGLLRQPWYVGHGCHLGGFPERPGDNKEQDRRQSLIKWPAFEEKLGLEELIRGPSCHDELQSSGIVGHPEARLCEQGSIGTHDAWGPWVGARAASIRRLVPMAGFMPLEGCLSH